MSEPGQADAPTCPKHRLAFVYRIYPTAAQETDLTQTLETCRGVYNSMLNWRKHDYDVLGKAPSKYEQIVALPVWKAAHPELSCVYAQVLQNVAVRVDLAFQAFFRRVKAGEGTSQAGAPSCPKKPGYPRAKGFGQYDSFTYPQDGFKVGTESVHLSRIGQIKACVHRSPHGAVKTCTVRRVRHKWYVCFSCEVEPEPLEQSDESVGIDVGLKTFAALDNGEFIDNPRFFRKDEKALAQAQRKLSKQTRGSRERRKTKKVVGRIHERIRNRRHDFVHQTARRIVNRFGVIAVEKLTVNNMMGTPAPKPDPDNEGQFLPNGASAKAGLNKSIADASWSMFRNVLSQKAARAARVYTEVNPAYTSQICSGCGSIVKKTLKERTHWCQACGLVLDRDTNAAVNILQRAVGQHCVGS